MEENVLLIIEQKVNFLYKKNLVHRWPSDLINAQLVIKYAFCSETIFDLLKSVIFTENLCLHKIVDHENIEIQNETVADGIEMQIWSFYKSNLNDTEYFNTLTIPKWEYNEFVVSAFIFCIQSKLHNEFLLKRFVSSSAQYLAPNFLIEDLLSYSIFLCIVELKLFDFFPKHAAKGLIRYLQPSYSPQMNIQGRIKAISKFLYIFSFFPMCFINQCLRDCEKQNNVNPIIIALYVLYIDSQNLQEEKKIASEELDHFKKKLIRGKLLNNKFPSRCNFSFFKDKQKKLLFEKYYS